MLKVFAICLITFSIIFPAKYPYKITTNSEGKPLALTFKWTVGVEVARALKDYELLKQGDDIYQEQNTTISNLIYANSELRKGYKTHNKQTKIKSFLKGLPVGGGITLIVGILIKILLL